MNEMRMLGTLFQHFKTHCPEAENCQAMFFRKNLASLRLAIADMTNGKHGLALNLHATMQKSIKILKGLFIEEDRPQASDEVEKVIYFVVHFSHLFVCPFVFFFFFSFKRPTFSGHMKFMHLPASRAYKIPWRRPEGQRPCRKREK